MFRTISLLCIALALALSAARADVPPAQIADLMQAIRGSLPKGWTASYEKDSAWVEVSRDALVLATSALPNGPPDEKPERSKFCFAFRIVPAVSSAEYKRLSRENATIQKKLQVMYEDLRKTIDHKFDDFLPRTENDVAAVARYEALKQTLHDLPHFHYREVGLKWELSSPDNPMIGIIDDAARDECDSVRSKVVSLLSKYEDA
jgi:hypothetical protein